MPKERLEDIPWDFYCKLIVIIFSVLQVIRWVILPQFMDMYYHLLTARGFIQAGGYSGWDFLQYAPYGRPHIYPPLFHILLAILLKLGISNIFLAKLFESVMPVVFLIVLWFFVRRNYGARLAFFTLVTFCSSFSFCLSLSNHIPATLALILGIFAFDQLFRNNVVRAAVLLTLSFYTHIGVSWFFALAFIFYGIADGRYRKKCWVIFSWACALSLPVLCTQFRGIGSGSFLGSQLQEKYFCQIKIIEYVLAFLGLALAFKGDKKYRLFPSLFLSGLMFILYPYRLVSGEGYLPVIFLSAYFLYCLYEKFDKKSLALILACGILFLSPTFSMDRPVGQERVSSKLKFADSAFMGLLFVKGDSIWYPQEYFSAAAIVRDNSEKGDIIYSSFNITGMIVACLSDRATANALFPEVGPCRKFDPFDVSKIIVFTKADEPATVQAVVNTRKLVKIGENNLFLFYVNPSCVEKARVRKASVSFWVISLIAAACVLVFWRGRPGRGAKVN
jgi:hypothetical protein